MESKLVQNTLKDAPGAHESCLLSADMQLELRLKDLLLDIEERTWQGTLGGIKVCIIKCKKLQKLGGIS